MALTTQIEKYYKFNNEELQKKENAIEVRLYYSKGGYSYATYRNTKRGWRISINLVKRTQRSGCSIIESTPSQGYLLQVNEISRNSKKAMEECVDYFEQHRNEMLANMFSEVKTEWELISEVIK